MSTHTSSANITHLTELDKVRGKQVCAPPHGGPCDNQMCNRLHLTRIAGTKFWASMSRGEFNKPGQQRVCPYDFASVHPGAYPRSRMYECTGCNNAHVKASVIMPGCFETVPKDPPDGFTLESI